MLVQTLVRRLPAVAEIPESDRASYASRAEAAVRDAVLPAYQRQIDALRAVRSHAVHDAGIWRLPQGAEMYAAALRTIFLLYIFFGLFADLWLNPITYVMIGLVITMRRCLEARVVPSPAAVRLPRRVPALAVVR